MEKTPAHEELVSKIRATRGFRVAKPNQSGIAVTNTTTGRHCRVPFNLGTNNLDACLHRLRAIGWTPKAYKESQERKSIEANADRRDAPTHRATQEPSEDMEAVRASFSSVAHDTHPRRVWVTPELAAQWLETVPDYQRNLDRAVVKDFTAAMIRGEWRLIHQAIGIDVNGKLLDGQHRLESVRLSQTTQEFWVMDGLPEETYKYVDRGKKRSNADAFKGRKNPTLLPKVLRLLYLRDAGVPQLEWARHPKVSIDQLEQTDREHPLLEEHLDVPLSMRRIGCSPIGAGYAYYLISTALDYDLTLPSAWFKKIYSGIGMYEGDPAAALRHYFSYTSKTQDTKARLLGAKRTAGDRDAYLLIEGWNKTCAQQTIQRFSPRLDTFVIGTPRLPPPGSDVRYFGVIGDGLPPGFQQ